MASQSHGCCYSRGSLVGFMRDTRMENSRERRGPKLDSSLGYIDIDSKWN